MKKTVVEMDSMKLTGTQSNADKKVKRLEKLLRKHKKIDY